MSFLQNSKTITTSGEGTAVRSHLSFDSQVHAICHHSGQYLTSEEANHPIWKQLITRFLREQHDFPGLRNLDRAFALPHAAHAENHQHIIWSRISIQSLALLALTPALFFLLFTLFNLQDYVPLALWYVFLGGLALLAVWGATLILIALWRSSRRESIFHKNASGKPPAIADYPVRGEFHIAAHEKVIIDLDNINRDHPTIQSQSGELIATLRPQQDQWEEYQAYRQQYAGLDVGVWVHGGALALENLGQVCFLPDALEFDHRLVLRLPAYRVGLDDNRSELSALVREVNYEVLPGALYPPYNGLTRFPLEIEPRLSPNDSRTVELHFSWRGSRESAGCKLDECILDIPDVLGQVTQVKYGRYDRDRQQVVWRNRSFRDHRLVLSITFERPVLNCQDLLQGTYSFSFEGLLSGMKIRKERVWTVLGQPVKPEACQIVMRTEVNGRLTINLQRLSQEHEHIQAMPPIVCDAPPDENLVRAVTNVLLEEGFDLQRVTRTAPRLDPTGRLDQQLFYWDISGRRYIEELLDALDVHVVITGSDRVVRTIQANDDLHSRTYIDLRVRCLHDPRNTSTPQAVDTLVGRKDQFSLANKIRTAVNESRQHS